MTRMQLSCFLFAAALSAGFITLWPDRQNGNAELAKLKPAPPNSTVQATSDSPEVPDAASISLGRAAGMTAEQTADVRQKNLRMLEFHKAKNLKRLFDTYSTPAYERDGRARYLQARALIVCGPFLNTDPDTLIKRLFSNQDKSLPRVKAMTSAIATHGQECAGFTGAAQLSDAKKFLEGAAALGDLPALSRQLLDLHDAGKTAEARSLARQVLMTPSAEAIEGLTTYFAYRGSNWTFGSDGREYSKEVMQDAWRSVSCTWEDADCGSGSRALREICWTQGACQFASFDDYLSRSKYSRADYEIVAGLRQKILHAILTRSLAELGLEK